MAFLKGFSMRLAFAVLLAVPLLSAAHPRLFLRTGQPPLDEAGVKALLASGMDPEVVMQLLEERRCACDVSPQALARWREGGVPDEVIAAASLHALPPNRRLALSVVADTTSRTGRSPARGWLHLFVRDGPRWRALHVPLGEGPEEAWTDARSVLRRRRTREVSRAALELSAPGRHEAWVAWSEQPWAERPEELPGFERVRARHFTLDIPAATSRRACRVRVGLRTDDFRPGRARLEEATWDCEWE